jgi:hypothetical protein
MLKRENFLPRDQITFETLSVHVDAEKRYWVVVEINGQVDFVCCGKRPRYSGLTTDRFTGVRHGLHYLDAAKVVASIKRTIETKIALKHVAPMAVMPTIAD